MTDQDNPAGASASPFAISGMDATFGNRSHNVFDCLDNIEAKHSAYQAAQATSSAATPSGLIKDDPEELPSLAPKSRGFKRPHGPPMKARRPDFTHNPSKWTKYDLSDVTGNDMSESANKAAAFDFLRSLPKRQKTDHGSGDGSGEHNADASNSMEVDEGQAADCSRHVFKKPENSGSASDGPVCKAGSSTAFGHGHGRLVMPEYVVGQKVLKPGKPQSTSNMSKGTVKVQDASVLDIRSSWDDPEQDDPEEKSSPAAALSSWQAGRAKAGMFKKKDKKINLPSLHDKTDEKEESGSSNAFKSKKVDKKKFVRTRKDSDSESDEEPQSKGDTEVENSTVCSPDNDSDEDDAIVGRSLIPESEEMMNSDESLSSTASSLDSIGNGDKDEELESLD